MVAPNGSINRETFLFTLKSFSKVLMVTGRVAADELVAKAVISTFLIPSQKLFMLSFEKTFKSSGKNTTPWNVITPITRVTK